MTTIETGSDATITDLSIITSAQHGSVLVEARFTTGGDTWEGVFTETTLFGLLAGAGHLQRRPA